MIPTSLMIRICQHKEHILQYGEVELLEEHARGLRIRIFSHVVYQLNAHAQTGILYLSVVMLASPHARVNDKFELAAVQFKKRRETVEVDGFQKLEEFHSVLWILGEVFVDHLKRAFKDILHDCRHFIGHETLVHVSNVASAFQINAPNRMFRGIICPTYIELGNDSRHHI